MNLQEKAEMSKIIIQHAVEKYPRLFVACSFGKDSRVVADLAMQVNPKIQFFGIDTGYEFPETLSFAARLSKEIGMKFKWAHPAEKDKKRIDKLYGDSFILNDQYKCCEMKIPAVERLLGKYDAWGTGLRRDETEFRKNTPLI